MPFDLRRKRAVAPGGELRIEGGYEGVRGDPHRRRGGIEKTVIAWVPRVNLKTPHRAGDEIQRLDRACRLGEIAPRQLTANLLDVEFGRDSRRLYVRQVILDDFNQTRQKLYSPLIHKHQ